MKFQCSNKRKMVQNKRKLNSKKICKSKEGTFDKKPMRKPKSGELIDESPSKLNAHKGNIMGKQNIPKESNMKGSHENMSQKRPLHFLQEEHLQKGTDNQKHTKKKKCKEISNSSDSFLPSKMHVPAPKALKQKNVTGSDFKKRDKKPLQSESSPMPYSDQPRSDKEIAIKKKRKNHSEHSSTASSRQTVIQEIMEVVPKGNNPESSEKVKCVSEISVRTDKKLKDKTKKKRLCSGSGDDVENTKDELKAPDVQLSLDYGSSGKKKKKRVKSCESSFDGTIQNASSTMKSNTNFKTLSTPEKMQTLPCNMDKGINSESPRNDSSDFIKLPQKKIRGFEGREDTPERLSRTVFVGNLPLSFNRKLLHSLFRCFGEIESVRLRSAVPAKSSVPKKVALIRKEFHSKSDSVNGFVVFKNREMVENAMTLNKTVVEGHHIRVDSFKADVAYDDKRSVFVGNLPYNVTTENLWTVFGECGGIEAVRIVRDPESGIGKGFGFVLFEECDSVGKALLLNETEVGGRSIRVKPVEKGNKLKLKAPLKNRRSNLKEKKSPCKSHQRSAGQKKTYRKSMKRKVHMAKKKQIASILT